MLKIDTPETVIKNIGTGEEISCPEETNPSPVGFGNNHLSSWTCFSNHSFPKDF